RPGGPELVIFGLIGDQALLGAVCRAKAIDAEVKVVVLVPEPERELVLGLLDGGADAVLPRTASEDELRDAVRRVTKGERLIAPGLLAMLLGDVVAPDPTIDDDHPLTDRERTVLALLVEGRSNRQIAGELCI